MTKKTHFFRKQNWSETSFTVNNVIIGFFIFTILVVSFSIQLINDITVNVLAF